MPTLRRTFFGALIALTTLASMNGCATTDHVVLTSSRRLNMCEGADPHPIVVRLYYLRGSSRFVRADFETLWEDDLSALEDDRIQVLERTLNPTQQLPLSIKREGDAKQATAIGVVANFCRPGEGCWRQVVPLEGKKGEIRIHVDEDCLSVD